MSEHEIREVSTGQEELDGDWYVIDEPYDIEIGKQQMREANERNRQQENRLGWIIGLGLTVLLLWGYVFWRIHRMIVQ